MNKQELIKKYENTCCTIISINGVLEDLRQLDEPQSMKLKDVIARIKKLDLGSQELWLNEILNKLGSDYGSLKYRAGYEQGKFDCAMERDKVTVPQFVADWIDYCKENHLTITGAFDPVSEHGIGLAETFKGSAYKCTRWALDNQNLFARAWLDGYEVEKEKRYRVSLKNGQPLLKAILGKALYFSQDIAIESYKVTRKELEEAGFGWVLDCPGVEVEEVTE